MIMMWLPIIAWLMVITQTLAPGQKNISTLPAVKEGTFLLVEVRGEGKGDIDCYLLHHHGIISRDERDANQCTLGYTPRDNDPIKLLVINHGDTTVKYRATAEQ
jgi:hypothetical protein